VGVTNHYSRIAIPNNPVNNDQDFLKLVDAPTQPFPAAVDTLKSCGDELFGHGHGSAATFSNGRKGAPGVFGDKMQDEAGVGVSLVDPFQRRLH
jgi:maleate isomerase